MNTQQVIQQYSRAGLLSAVLDPPPRLDVALTIKGLVNGYTGYGQHTCDTAATFDNWGYQVALQPVEPVQLTSPVIDRCLKRPAKGIVLAIQPVSYPFVPADYWFTMYETTAMPQAYVRALEQAGAIIVPSAWNASCFQAQGVRRPIHVCPLGVNPSLFAYVEPNRRKCVFGAAGNTSLSVAARKNLDLAVKAFCRAFPSQTDVELRLKILPSCDPPPATDPRIKITQAILSDEGMALWMQDLTAFVLPSRAEAWGFLALQAMACGKPVLAAPFAGVAEFFNGCNGYLVDYDLVSPKDCFHGLGLWAEPRLDSMIEQMRLVYENESLCAAKSVAARQTAELFTWEASHLKLEALLERPRPASPVPRRKTEPMLIRASRAHFGGKMVFGLDDGEGFKSKELPHFIVWWLEAFVGLEGVALSVRAQPTNVYDKLGRVSYAQFSDDSPEYYRWLAGLDCLIYTGKHLSSSFYDALSAGVLVVTTAESKYTGMVLRGWDKPTLTRQMRMAYLDPAHCGVRIGKALVQADLENL